MRITDPIHGAVLNRHYGRQTDDSLTVTVRGQAGPDERVTVNGQPARRQGESFAVEVALREKETDIVGVGAGPPGRREHRIRVVWDRHSKRRFRMSIDDNCFFLRDIAQQGYKSLFDCFYLKALRDLHERYGVKYTVNIFFETIERDFQISRFPDRYKGEWADNADWLKLAFHAYREMPARPYQYAPAERLAADFDAVAAEIHRFAGPRSYCPPTVIHWAMCQPAHYGVLAQRGVTALSTLLRRLSSGWDVHYFLDESRCDWLHTRLAVKDFDSGIIFSDCDIVLNGTPLPAIVPRLQARTADPRAAEVLDLFTHEQYFWPFYAKYLPDHVQRLDTAFRWARENNYEPVFLHEGLLGGKDW